MKKPIPAVEAVTQLWNLAKSNPIPGLNPYKQREFDEGVLPSQILGDGFDLSWERGWGVDARLRVNGVYEKSGKRVVLSVEVSWSSSTYSPAAAATAADLHARVAALACWMQAVIDSLPPLIPTER